MTLDGGRRISADLIYRDGRFREGLALELDGSGRIVGIGSRDGADVRLTNRALIPGFINGHSHAFQRGLRGKTSSRPSDRGDHFWTWREAMYRLVASLSPDDIGSQSVRAFREMAIAGYTAVGEFHYVHHAPDGRPYDDPNLLARRVIDAAREAGLRIVLLNVFYERGGLDDAPPSGGQRRFAGEDPEDFLERTEALAGVYRDDPAVTVGLAAHSVRAVGPASMRRLAEAARTEGRPYHIHLSEQVAEVEACLEVHGRRPVELAADLDLLGPGMTGVHCTHIDDGEIALLRESGATVCACPTTEADLGDGFLKAEELRAAGVPISLGSDSQARIDPFEEMRAVEYHERLRHGRRNVLVGREAALERLELAPELLAMGTRSGAASLGLDAGALEPGAWADFVEVDLDHPVLSGWSAETLAAMVALGGDPRIVAGTWVGGRRIA